MYVDGFVIPVPKSKVNIYKKMATIGRNVWMDHGAVDYKECVGDDLKNKWGKSFKDISKAKSGETVFFSFIVFKSRAHRDAVNKKVMADKRLKECCGNMPMPFEVKKMAYGGFKVLVDKK